MQCLTKASIADLAKVYAEGEHQAPSADLARFLRDDVLDWFQSIPVPVVFQKGDEPFNSRTEMCDFIERNGVLLMRDYEFPQSCVWLDAYNEMRAVHDWFGHHIGGPACKFTISGEIAAYRVHQTQLSREHWPYLWNETVLANAYAVHFKRRIGWDKVVPVGDLTCPEGL